MATLFETFDDMKAHVSGANVNNDITTMSGYIDSAIDEYMIPYLGRTFFDSFKDKYNTNSLSADEQALLPYIQKPLAHFAYYLFACDGGLMLDDSGITTAENAVQKRPAQWQVRDYKNNRLKNAWGALQTMLQYMWTNKAKYTVWNNSTERKELWRLVFWEASKFSKYRTIDGYGTLNALRPYMKLTLDYEITANLGEEFAEEIYTWLEGRATNADNEALLPYIERCVAYKTLYRAADDLPMVIKATGVYVEEVDRGLQNDNTTKISADLAKLKSTCDGEYQTALARLKAYLQANASSSKYATYFASDIYSAINTTTSPVEEFYTGKTFMM
jgi:hypothetical protein